MTTAHSNSAKLQKVQIENYLDSFQSKIWYVLVAWILLPALQRSDFSIYTSHHHYTTSLLTCNIVAFGQILYLLSSALQKIIILVADNKRKKEDKTQKLKFWPNSETQMVTQLKTQIIKKNSQTQILWNLKNLIVTNQSIKKNQ